MHNPAQADRDRWTAKTAGALCAASKWLSGASLLLALAAFGLGTARGGDAAWLSAITFIIAAGAVQVYLALRIDLDRRIFEMIAAEPTAVSDAFAGFDAALRELGLKRETRDRPAAERARGALALVRISASLLAAQFAAAVVLLWLAG